LLSFYPFSLGGKKACPGVQSVATAVAGTAFLVRAGATVLGARSARLRALSGESGNANIAALISACRSIHLPARNRKTRGKHSENRPTCTERILGASETGA